MPCKERDACRVQVCPVAHKQALSQMHTMGGGCAVQAGTAVYVAPRFVIHLPPHPEGLRFDAVA